MALFSKNQKQEDEAEVVSLKEAREMAAEVKRVLQEERDVWTDIVKWCVHETTSEFELSRIMDRADQILAERRKRFPV